MPPRWPTRFCCDEELAFLGYDGLGAAKDLAKWRAGHLYAATQELIDAVIAEGVEGARLIDIGAGVGAVHISLLQAGASSAIDVDASRDYLATARAEAERHGLAGRVTYRYGDVVELAAELPSADIVTLDSVICCYPSLPSLLGAAVRPGPRVVGLTYPRDVGWMRAYMRLWNLGQIVRNSTARYFIYRHAQVDRLMSAAGFEAVHLGGTRPWRVIVYRRSLAVARRES